MGENDGFLVLNERGQVDGEVQTIKPHPNFRLFMCVDPHFGELSRAMRNRGIEISLLGRFTTEDTMRISDHHRMPLVAVTESTDLRTLPQDYEAARRGLRDFGKSSFAQWPSAKLVGEDSANSTILDRAPSLFLISDVSDLRRALVHFMANNTIPAYMNYVRRFYRQLRELDTRQYLRTSFSVARNFSSSRLYTILADLLEKSSHISSIPVDLLMVQVSLRQNIAIHTLSFVRHVLRGLNIYSQRVSSLTPSW